jgi:hypothetical protein
VANAVVTGQIVAPPITRIALDQVPTLLSGATSVPADGKTVITYHLMNPNIQEMYFVSNVPT